MGSKSKQGGSIKSALGLIGLCLSLAACQRSALPQDVAYLDQLPGPSQFIAEYTGRQMNVVDVPDGHKYKWDLPTSAIEGPGAWVHQDRVTWAPGIRSFAFATARSATLISATGLATQLNLQMPGKLQPLAGMETYSISPDGQLLAYYLLTRDADEPQWDGLGHLYQDLMIQEAHGSAPRSILKGTRPSSITWSPDSDRIALGTGQGKLLVLDLSGKVLQSIPVRSGNKDPAGNPFDAIADVRWQPSGESIALIDNSELYIVHADGSNLHKVLLTPLPNSVAAFTWSPDGKHFAFRSVTSRSCHFALRTDSFRQCTIETALFVSDADGKNMKKVPGSDIGDDQTLGNTLFWLMRE